MATESYRPEGRYITARDVSNGWLSRPLVEHTDEVLALAFAPDGSTLASTGYDGRLLLWDVRGGAKPEELRKYARALYSVVFSPDGKYLGKTQQTEKKFHSFFAKRLCRTI